MQKIVTLTNTGYQEMTWNMLLSLSKCGVTVDDIRVYCLDPESTRFFSDKGYSVCDIPGENNAAFRPWSVGIGSEEYSKLTHTKCDVMIHSLSKFEDTLFIDGDVVILKDPRPMVNLLAKPFDIDGVFQDSLPDLNRHCTGFFFCKGRSRNRDFWIDLKEECKQHPQSNDQIVLKILLDKMTANPDYYLDGSPRKPDYRLLPHLLFPDGKAFFENPNWFTRGQHFIVHNNWIVGNEAKKKRFQEAGMWYV